MFKRESSVLGYLILFLVPYFVCCLWFVFDQAGFNAIMAPPYNRELGILELLQSIVLLLTLFVSYKQSRLTTGNQSLIWSLITLVLMLVLLEETDYGLHYFDYLMGNQPYTSNLPFNFRNIHNKSNNLLIIKVSSLIFQIVIFGFFPFSKRYFGKYEFVKKYGVFYWTTLIPAKALSFSFPLFLNNIEFIEYKRSQPITELLELAHYYMLFVFIYEYKNQLFSKP